MTNPYQVVRDLEAALCEYTGAPFAVTVNSCTMALTLAVAWHLRGTQESEVVIPDDDRDEKFDVVLTRPKIEIPRRTYVGVPYAIQDAGGSPTFRDEEWSGAYRLKPLLVWDAARYFSGGMFNSITTYDRSTFTNGGMVCVSFHASKTLGHSQGGAILHDNPEADAWLRRARFDGRTEGVAPAKDSFTMPRAWHCYLSTDVAAALLLKLHSLPRNNNPLPNDDYPDLSLHEAFR